MRYMMRVWSRTYGDGSLWFERLDPGWRVSLVFTCQAVDAGFGGEVDSFRGVSDDVRRRMLERGRGFVFTGRGSVLVLLDFVLVLFERFDLRDWNNHGRRADFTDFLMGAGVSVGDAGFAVNSSVVDYYSRLDLGEVSPLEAPFIVNPVRYGDDGVLSPCVRFKRGRSLVSCDGEPCELGWDNVRSGVTGLQVVAVPHRSSFMLDIVFDLAFAAGVAPEKCHLTVGVPHEILGADNVSYSSPERGNGVLSDVFLFGYGELFVFLRSNIDNGFLDSDDVLGIVDAMVRLVPHGYRGNDGVPFTVRDALDVFPELVDYQKGRLLVECDAEHTERWYRAMGIRPGLSWYC